MVTHRLLSAGHILIWVCSLSFETFASAAPVLESIFPMSCEAGKSVTVSLMGKNLEGGMTLVFSIPDVTSELNQEGKLVISVAAGTPPQDCDVWCVTDGRISNPRRFVVSALVSVAEAGGNDSIDTAQTISFPGAVDGRLETVAKLDWYQFEAHEGQTITLSCRSRSLDGSAHPVITLIDPSGQEIAHSTGRRREPLLSRRLSSSGIYRVQVSDRAYLTAADSVYRLELLIGPQIIAAWPDLIMRHAPPRPGISFYGYELPGESEPSYQVAASRSLVQKLVRDVPLSPDSLRPAWRGTIETFDASVPVRLDSDVSIVPGCPRIRLTDQEVTYEDEAATVSLTHTQQLSLPALLNGRFNSLNDIDWYSFDAKKDETVRIDIYGDRLGHLMDLDAAVMDATGKTLMAFPDAPTPKNLPLVLTQTSLDVAGVWKPPADGTYHLAVRDLYGSSLFGVDRTYVLALRRSHPAFDLVIAPPDETTPTGYSIPQNGRTPVRVLLLRRDGFDEAVRLRLTDATQNAGLTLNETWIGPGETSVLAMISNTPDLPVGSPARFLELEATTESEPSIIRQARAITLLRAGTEEGRFMNRLPVCVSPELPLTVDLSVASSEVRAGEKLMVSLKHTLTAGVLKSDAKIEFPVLPGGMKAPAAAIKAIAEESQVEIAVPDKMREGNYSLAAVVHATIVTAGEDKPVETAIQAWSNSLAFKVIPKGEPEAPAADN